MTGNDILADAYRSLGVTPQASDELVYAGYQLQLRTLPDNAVSHFDALGEVAASRQEKGKGMLQRSVQLERNNGAVGCVDDL